MDIHAFWRRKNGQVERMLLGDAEDNIQRQLVKTTVFQTIVAERDQVLVLLVERFNVRALLCLAHLLQLLRQVGAKCVELRLAGKGAWEGRRRGGAGGRSPRATGCASSW